MSNPSHLMALFIYALGAAGLLAGLKFTFHALRAKYRIAARIAEIAQDDRVVMAFREAAKSRRLTDADAAQAKLVIETIARELPGRDRAFIDLALHRNSRAGERQFIRELLCAA